MRFKAVLQFVCGILSAEQGGFFLMKKPLSCCGLALHQLESSYRPVLLVYLLAFAVAGCAHQPGSTASAVAPTLTGDPAHPSATKGWVDTKLYFGLGPADRPEQGISEAQWREFLDKQVTPRFPSGLSVIDVCGQWQGKSSTTPSRPRSKLLIVDYPDTEENRDKIEAIRAAWKLQTGQQSVLRITSPADVSF
jgi:hypothetical protein